MQLPYIVTIDNRRYLKKNLKVFHYHADPEQLGSGECEGARHSDSVLERDIVTVSLHSKTPIFRFLYNGFQER